MVAAGSCIFAASIVDGAVTPAAWLERLVPIPLGTDRKTSLEPRSRAVAIGANGASAALFCFMAVAGEGGLKWLDDPRTPYIANRAGDGVLSSAASWCLSVAVLALIWAAGSWAGGC